MSSKVLAGAGWAISMRWAVKLLGLVSSAILARLLMPEDYGLVAVAMIAAGIIQVLFELGVETALVQNENANHDHFDTAWTIRLFQAAVVAIALLLFSPFSEALFDQERLPFIMQIVALAVFLQGFENIGIVSFRKELDFNKEFQFFVVNKVIGVVITVSLAFYFKSYLALVFGILGQSLVNVGNSYVISSYRPRLCLTAFGDLWSFSKWLIMKNLSDYIGKQGDTIFLSKLTTMQGLGFYKWGSELSTMSSSEIVFPMLRSLMPGLVKVKSNKEKLEGAFLVSTGMITIVAVPIALGFAGVAAEFIPILLGGGGKWAAVIPISQSLAFAALLRCFYIIAANMLIVIGHIRLTAYTSWMRTILVLSLMYPAFQLGGVVGVANAQVLIGVITAIIVYLILVQKMQIRLSRVIGEICRPLTAGILMVTVLLNFEQGMTGSLFVILIIKVILGVFIYTSSLFIFWYFFGSPDSSERKIFNMISRPIQSKLGNLFRGRA